MKGDHRRIWDPSRDLRSLNERGAVTLEDLRTVVLPASALIPTGAAYQGIPPGSFRSRTVVTIPEDV